MEEMGPTPAAPRGIQTRVFGPTGSAADVRGAGFAMPAGTVQTLVGTFRGHMDARRNGPLQMLVEVPDVPPSVVNLYRYYGSAAVAHVLRANPAGDVPAVAGIVLLLPGADPDADEAAIAAVEGSRDATGTMLPLRPQAYASLRADARPLLAMLFFHEDAVRDVSLRMLAISLAEAFFGSIAPPAGGGGGSRGGRSA
jgi:hypothetical protein